MSASASHIAASACGVAGERTSKRPARRGAHGRCSGRGLPAADEQCPAQKVMTGSPERPQSAPLAGGVDPSQRGSGRLAAATHLEACRLITAGARPADQQAPGQRQRVELPVTPATMTFRSRWRFTAARALGLQASCRGSGARSRPSDGSAQGAPRVQPPAAGWGSWAATRVWRADRAHGSPRQHGGLAGQPPADGPVRDDGGTSGTGRRSCGRWFTITAYQP